MSLWSSCDVGDCVRVPRFSNPSIEWGWRARTRAGAGRRPGGRASPTRLPACDFSNNLADLSVLAEIPETCPRFVITSTS